MYDSCLRGWIWPRVGRRQDSCRRQGIDKAVQHPARLRVTKSVVAFGSGHRLACFQLGKPGIGFLMCDMLASRLKFLPSLQPGLPQRLTFLFALDKLRHRLAQHPVRGAVLGIRQPLEAVTGVLIELYSDGADGVRGTAQAEYSRVLPSAYHRPS